MVKRALLHGGGTGGGGGCSTVRVGASCSMARGLPFVPWRGELEDSLFHGEVGGRWGGGLKTLLFHDEGGILCSIVRGVPFVSW